MKYTCSCCGKEHEEWPAITFSLPSNYKDLSDEERERNSEIGNDYCIIYSQYQTDRFIRVTLIQKIIDHCENLKYGVWVSLSEKSYKDYEENYNNKNHIIKYFGGLSNCLPDYPDTRGIPTMVNTKEGTKRPEVFPDPEFDHPFVKDYYNGITKKEAERRISEMLKSSEKLKK